MTKRKPTPWKDVPGHQSLRRGKSKPQWGPTSHPLGWPVCNQQRQKPLSVTGGEIGTLQVAGGDVKRCSCFGRQRGSPAGSSSVPQKDKGLWVLASSGCHNKTLPTPRHKHHKWIFFTVLAPDRDQEVYRFYPEYPGKDSLPDLQTDGFLLCPALALLLCMHRWRRELVSLPLLEGHQSYGIRAPPLWAH